MRREVRTLNLPFVYEKTGHGLERRHICARNGRPCDSDEFFGGVEPRGEQVLRRATNSHATINPEVVKGEKRSPKL
jgi:hypothetical protein